MKRLLAFVILASSLPLSAQFIPHAPARAAYCLTPAGTWVPIATAQTGSTLSNGGPASDTYGLNSNGSWYGLACDANGNLTPGGTAGGDLSGTYPNPSVVKVNGAAVPVAASSLASNSLGQLTAALSAGFVNAYAAGANGSAGDNALVSAAIAAAGCSNSSACVVYFPALVAGACYQVHGLPIYSSITYQGDGQGSCIQVPTGANDNMFTGTVIGYASGQGICGNNSIACYVASGQSGSNSGNFSFTIQNLLIDGNGGNQTGASYGLLEYGAHYYLQNVVMRYFYSDCIYTDFNPASHATSFEGASSWDNIELYGCGTDSSLKVKTPGAVGLRMAGFTDAKIDRLSIHNNASHNVIVGPNGGAVQFGAGVHLWGPQPIVQVAGSVTYVSGGSVPGTGSGTCIATATGGFGGSGAVGTLAYSGAALSGTLTFTNYGTATYTSVPTTWTLSGTGCSGTATTSGGSLVPPGSNMVLESGFNQCSMCEFEGQQYAASTLLSADLVVFANYNVISGFAFHSASQNAEEKFVMLGATGDAATIIAPPGSFYQTTPGSLVPGFVTSALAAHNTLNFTIDDERTNNTSASAAYTLTNEQYNKIDGNIVMKSGVYYSAAPYPYDTDRAMKSGLSSCANNDFTGCDSAWGASGAPYVWESEPALTATVIPACAYQLYNKKAEIQDVGDSRSEWVCSYSTLDAAYKWVPTNGTVNLYSSRIHMGIAPTGVFTTNGSLTLGTALSKTYSDGVYLWFPANAITGSEAAGFYWCVFTTTTAATCYNSQPWTTVPGLGSAGSNTGVYKLVSDGASATDCATGSGTTFVQCYSNGSSWAASSYWVGVQAGATTPFSSSGGAYVGATATTVQVGLTNILASVMGTRGRLEITTYWSASQTASNKTAGLAWGASHVHTPTADRSASVNSGSNFAQFTLPWVMVENGTTALQLWEPAINQNNGGSSSYVSTALSTTADEQLAVTAAMATATDNIILDGWDVRLVRP